MSQDLTIFQQAGLPQKFDDNVFEKIAKSGDWLPRVQLFGGENRTVKSGKFPIGHFGLVKDSNTPPLDLGESFDAVLVAWRPKAMQFGDDDNVNSWFDVESAEFKSAMAQADADSRSGYAYGPEFLLWMPSLQKFTTFFCGNKTLRREAGNTRSMMQRFVTFKAKFIETKEYAWHGMVTVECSVPPSAVPTPEELKEQYDKFVNPPKTAVKEKDEAPTRDR